MSDTPGEMGYQAEQRQRAKALDDRTNQIKKRERTAFAMERKAWEEKVEALTHAHGLERRITELEH